MPIETKYIWRNWEIVNWDMAIDHNLIHTLHYGGWVFEWIRFYDTPNWPKIFRLKEHIDRLFYSAKLFEMELSFTSQNLMDACVDLVVRNWINSGYIRPIIYFWYSKMWLYPKWAKLEIVISVWNWGTYLSDNPIKVMICKIRRLDRRSADMWAKVCGYYANSIVASLETHGKGFDEWLLLDTDWNIAEWPGENIFFVKGKQIVTPKLWSILPGITRATVIQLLKDKFWIIVEERNINPNEIFDFDEAFFTGTAAEVTIIWSIQDQNWKIINYNYEQDSISYMIKKVYLDVVKGNNQDYLGRLY